MCVRVRAQMIGTVSSEMLGHVLESFAQAARLTLHVDVLKGTNCHHKVRVQRAAALQHGVPPVLVSALVMCLVLRESRTTVACMTAVKWPEHAVDASIEAGRI
jgi:Imidazoleglycerol-phosphate dehydratase